MAGTTTKKMLYARMNKDDIHALDNAVKNMKEMTRSRLIRIIILDWLEKYPNKNN